MAAGRLQMRRRARGVGLRGLLVERDDELALIERRLADARAGEGGVVVIEAFAGKGKSRLISVAGDLAREAEMQVLGAQGSELERDFPFGVAMQLFEPRWMAAGQEDRERLLRGPARRAAEILTGTLQDGDSFPGDNGYAVIHGLFWLACNIAAPPADESPGTPLVMLIDDAHWADRPSLRFLAYLAERITDLPIALMVAVRPGEATIDRRALSALRSAAAGAQLRPGPLTEAGVRAIVETVFPDADEAFSAACSRVTNGNPFLLSELLEQLRVDGERPTRSTAARLAEMAPESVLNAVVGRLGSMPHAAGAVAQAVAILGDGASLRQVARLANLDIEEAANAADALAATHLFHPGAPLSFVHALIRASVRASMSPLDRGRSHRRAADILREEGAPEEQVAAHILSAPPGADPIAVEVLRSAARKARATGAADTAVRMLNRALAEQPSPTIYPEVLAELAQAESAAGMPQAVERLEDAIRMTGDAPRRAELGLAHGNALYEQGRYEEAVRVLAASLDELDGDNPGIADELEAAYVAAAALVPRLADEARARGKRLVARVSGTPTPPQRHALAHLALRDSLRGEDRASIMQLVSLAWGDGALLVEETPDGLTWPLLTAALLFADELEYDLEISEAAMAGARARDSPQSYAAASYCRAWALYERGCVGEAIVDAQAALDANPHAWRNYVRTAYGALAYCHMMRGELQPAEIALANMEQGEMRDSVHFPFLLGARAELRLAQHRPEEALADALEAGRRVETDYKICSPGAIPWRSTAALAHLALGHQSQAGDLAGEELHEARRTGITRVIIRNLRILGLAERGPRGVELLSEAVESGRRYPQRLEYIHALIDYGAALRRANQRTAAREPLRKALELSHRGGATALAERAQTELNATGARPRRAMLTGIESLTPSERRVAEVAAKGLTTRQIAESLFVTPKTVEFHLRHIYQKLDVGSRAQLAEALGSAPGEQ